MKNFLKKAEFFYIASGKHDKAIGMYNEAERTDDVMRLMAIYYPGKVTVSFSWVYKFFFLIRFALFEMGRQSRLFLIGLGRQVAFGLSGQDQRVGRKFF